MRRISLLAVLPPKFASNFLHGLHRLQLPGTEKPFEDSAY